MDFKELLKYADMKFEDSDFYKIQMAHDTIIEMNKPDRKKTPEDIEVYMNALFTIAHYLCNGYVLIDVDRASKCVKMEKEETIGTIKEMLNDLFGKDEEDD